MKPEIKICCISSFEEAELVLKSGINHIGLVGPMPSGPGIIDPELIKKISTRFSNQHNTWLLTSQQSIDNILTEYSYVKTTHLQIVDEIPIPYYRTIKKEFPSLKLVQVIHVIDHESKNRCKEIEEHVDFLLLDSGNPKSKTKKLGGTGKTHNWEISKIIVEKSKIPVFLAGGINEANVSEAYNTVKPYGIDLCTGVRTNGHLDKRKLEIFIEQVTKLEK